MATGYATTMSAATSLLAESTTPDGGGLGMLARRLYEGRRWIEPIMAYCAIGRSSGPVEEVNNLIELHRRISRGSVTSATTGCGWC